MNNKKEHIPLAQQMRPKKISQIKGQGHLFSPKYLDNQENTDTKNVGLLDVYLEQGKLPSMVLWGPPGSGKTSIAQILAEHIHGYFVSISAVLSGIADVKKIFLEAQERKQNNIHTVLFVDEIHRFNKSQQDGFLHAVEEGLVTLIGATTENPSFELNNALLSRMSVFILHALDEVALKEIFEDAQSHLGYQFNLNEDALLYLLRFADGDARRLLNAVEILDAFYKGQKNNEELEINKKDLAGILGEAMLLYDSHADQHYNLISALHKSIRGSDPDAALYYLSRMIVGGEDIRYIARRLLRCAYEDVGLADPQAVVQAMTAWQSYERLGSPEGEIAIAQVVVYLALAPKSNAVYTAIKKASKSAKTHGSLSPPSHILNAPTKLMKDEGYGKNYKYDHDFEDGFSGDEYFPDAMKHEFYYKPIERGFEREMKKRITYFNKLRKLKRENKK